MPGASQPAVNGPRSARDPLAAADGARVGSRGGMVEVRVFGGVRVAREGAAPQPVEGRPARALLCWLALHRGPQPRALVAARLWPGVLEQSARVSLRSALTSLRRSLPESVAADRDSVELRSDV